MLKDWIFRFWSQRYICKVISIVGGIAIMGLAAIEKLTGFSTILWVSSPMLLFWGRLKMMDGEDGADGAVGDREKMWFYWRHAGNEDETANEACDGGKGREEFFDHGFRGFRG